MAANLDGRGGEVEVGRVVGGIEIAVDGYLVVKLKGHGGERLEEGEVLDACADDEIVSGGSCLRQSRHRGQPRGYDIYEALWQGGDVDVALERHVGYVGGEVNGGRRDAEVGIDGGVAKDAGEMKLLRREIAHVDVGIDNLGGGNVGCAMSLNLGMGVVDVECA